MRASAAFPTAGRRCRTVAELRPAIAKAERAYEQLLRQHLDHARHHLTPAQEAGASGNSLQPLVIAPYGGPKPMKTSAGQLYTGGYRLTWRSCSSWSFDASLAAWRLGSRPVVARPARIRLHGSGRGRPVTANYVEPSPLLFS